MHRRTTSMALAMAALLSATAAHAQAQPPAEECLAKAKKYMKLNGLSGNCIFSSKLMSACQEETFTDVRERFKEGDDTSLHARCYFLPAAQLDQELAKKGMKVLRERSRLCLPNEECYTMNFTIRRPADRFSSRFQLLTNDNRDFSKVRIEEALRDKSDPQRICLYELYDVDAGKKIVHEPTSDGRVESREVADIRELIVASGCFDWIPKKK